MLKGDDVIGDIGGPPFTPGTGGSSGPDSCPGALTQLWSDASEPCSDGAPMPVCVRKTFAMTEDGGAVGGVNPATRFAKEMSGGGMVDESAVLILFDPDVRTLPPDASPLSVGCTSFDPDADD